MCHRCGKVGHLKASCPNKVGDICSLSRSYLNKIEESNVDFYSGNMSALCNIAKTKLNCTYCDLKGSHNTSACLKKKKANKNKEKKKETIRRKTS